MVVEVWVWYMDKITRVLLMYSKLLRGEPVNKTAFCMETESNARSFDRDVEDIRLFLSESYSTNEVIYDRLKNCYYLSGVVRQSFEMTEYRFLERMLIQSETLRKDELVGLLSLLASNTTTPRECLHSVEEKIKGYENLYSAPLLKMQEDISHVINSKSCIIINYQRPDHRMSEYEIIPYDIEFLCGKMFLIAISMDEEEPKVRHYSLEKIESFTKVRTLSLSEWMQADRHIHIYREKSGLLKNEIIIECRNDIRKMMIST